MLISNRINQRATTAETDLNFEHLSIQNYD